jgi:hypothetical protein
LFENDVVNKITIVKIPHKRDYMHIDTVFTQVKRNVWVLLRSLTITETEQSQREPIAWFADKKNKDKPEIVQFRKDKKPKPLPRWKTCWITLARRTCKAPSLQSSFTRAMMSSRLMPASNGRIAATCWPLKMAWFGIRP